MAASSGLHSHRTTVKGMQALYHTERMMWQGAALAGEIIDRIEVGN